VHLEDLTPNTTLRGLLPGDAVVTVVAVQWHGSATIELVYKRPDGQLGSQLLFRDDETRLEIVDDALPWTFGAKGEDFRLAAEALRIRLAYLFDPVLAVHSSDVTPLPHQITAVYEAMLPRQPLKFLLADDPGAGKTIMAGLLIKELILRGDLKRCLIVCPGSLAEQWQDELHNKFDLPFEIVTNDNLEAARSGNYFLEHDLVIARLDKLSRNEDVQRKLAVPEASWDLVVVDEAHKMSATFFASEIKYTKRYRLGQLLGGITRHLLLMSATPHNGKEEDFQLFMALLDADQFAGRSRNGAEKADVSHHMRRMVKESLVKFDGRPLFPERIATSLPYRLSDGEAQLYKLVTEYVREQWDRAKNLENEGRMGTVGFALTILQRRLASSPEAIYQSLRRRRERLESRLREVELLQRGGTRVAISEIALDPDDIEDLDDAPDHEAEVLEDEVLDQATAARTIDELRIEIGVLRGLETKALEVRRSSTDTKWRQLSGLLQEVFDPGGDTKRVVDHPAAPRVASGRHQKLVIFTEHRDTMYYLQQKIGIVLGSPEALVTIHGGMARESRLNAQEAFRNDPEVKVLLATDAAGEGINLQRAHLMVNYDLPWNPNRLEQRFGRIHRIGQTEVCHLWNLVANETREGDVYYRLLEKLETARNALGGQVFDVLGKLEFEGRSLRDLLIEAVIYGDKPEVRSKLERVIEGAVDQAHLQDLIEDRVLAVDSMDTTEVARVRHDMERAEARRLQPNYIEGFFLEAFKRLGGTARERESRRYEITNVPAVVRNRDLLVGVRVPIQQRYERIAFEKDRLRPNTAFVTPGHPLLMATVDLTLERLGDSLRHGTILVDDRDESTDPRLLVTLEHAIVDGQELAGGGRRVISQRLLFVELTSDAHAKRIEYAPYIDYRPLGPSEPEAGEILELPEFAWLKNEVEQRAVNHALATVVPDHLKEVREHRLALVHKTRAAVHSRLTREIAHWDGRATKLQLDELAGKPNAKLNSREANRRAQELQSRLSQRMTQLDRESQVDAQAPRVLAGTIVVPMGLLLRMRGEVPPPTRVQDTQASAARARQIIMEVERGLGNQPKDVELERRGYDIESLDPRSGRLRLIEVKGRVTGAATITVTKNEINYALNAPETFILAIVEFHAEDEHSVHYVREPFRREPDFSAVSVNYAFSDLLSRAEPPA
jgi:SNF2 family DNA or RNA helicase